MSILDVALAYADREWPVFVLSASKIPVRNCPRCDPGSDRYELHDPEPCECLSCHGFYGATRDQDRIAEMFRRHPKGLLAVRTGAVSGLVVVDVDIKLWAADGFWPHSDDEGYRTLAKLDAAGVLPGTLMQITGSGGLHLLYAHPGGYIMSGANRLGPKADVKADGAYVLVAPSVNPRTGRRYRWAGDGRFDHAPAPLHELLIPRLRPPPPRPRPAPSSRPTTLRGRLGGLLQAVLDAPEGKRNDMVWWAARKAGEMIADGELDESTAIEALERAALSAGLMPAETRRTITSGLHRAGVS